MKSNNENTKHTPELIRQAQNMACELGHLNKGIASLVDLYAAAPDYDLMARHLEAWWRLPNSERTIKSIEPIICECLAAIAKATSKG